MEPGVGGDLISIAPQLEVLIEQVFLPLFITLIVGLEVLVRDDLLLLAQLWVELHIARVFISQIGDVLRNVNDMGRNKVSSSQLLIVGRGETRRVVMRLILIN